MTDRRHAREKQLFLDALVVPHEQRDAFVDEHCHDDAELARRLQSLLAHATADAPEEFPTSDRFERFTAALADRYRIEQPIGRGGMGTVFLARDKKHGRPVAVKVMTELSAAVNAERFLREVQITASLNHPHILPLLDSGRAAGMLYYVMPFVNGETVRDRLYRERQLSAETAFRIAHHVAEALVHAHRRHVIHRDIKPENILIADEQVVVADFGIARSVQVPTGDRITLTGSALGTPSYMSPEQLLPAMTLDPRTDIYSLGVVLYEMLVGALPERPVVPSAARAGRIIDAPPAHRAVLDALPAEAERTLARALAFSPDDRFADAGQLGDAIRSASMRLAGGRPSPARIGAPKLAGATALVVLALLVIWSPWNGSVSVDGSVAPRTLAVLPFENLGTVDDEHFADGLTEAITARLAQIPGLAVVSRQSAVQYRGATKSAQEIGRDLGVEYLIEGTVQRERPGDPSSRVRVIPQLVRAEDDTHVWADTYDRTMAEVFEVQSDIAERIAGQLAVTLEPTARGGASGRPTENLEAYEYYLRGRRYVYRRSEWDQRELQLASEMYTRAVELDPDFALARARLAEIDMLHFDAGIDRSDERLRLARAQFERALATDPTLAAAHLARARYYYRGRVNLDSALQAVTTVLRLEPSNTDALSMGAGLLAAKGRWDEAWDDARRASDLDPLSFDAAFSAAIIGEHVRDFDQGIRLADRAIGIDPDASPPYALKARMILSWNGNVAAAQEVVDEMARMVSGLRLASALANYDLWALVGGGAYDDLFEEASKGTFGDARPITYYLAKAKFHYVRRHAERARVYFDSVRVMAEGWLQERPEDHLIVLVAGLGNAGTGRAREALAAADRYLELRPLISDHLEASPAIWNLAFIRMLAGDHDGAVDLMELSLSMPTAHTAAQFRTDPIWSALHDHPGFQRLVASASP